MKNEIEETEASNAKLIDKVVWGGNGTVTLFVNVCVTRAVILIMK